MTSFNYNKEYKKLKARISRRRFIEDGRKGIDVFDLDEMPQGELLCCDRCKHGYFLCEYTMDGRLVMACDKCHYESEIRGIVFSESKTKGFVNPSYMMPGDVRCPNDKCKRFAFWKASHEAMYAGCRTCDFEWYANINVMGAELMDEFKYSKGLITDI